MIQLQVFSQYKNISFIYLKGTKENVTVRDYKEYEATGGLIDYNEPIFTSIENKLYNHLKNTKTKLKYISFAY